MVLQQSIVTNLEKWPFIPFPNNNTNTNDLKNIKPLIDVYDKVYSGFVMIWMIFNS